MTTKRRSHLTAQELRRQLLLVPEVNLETVPGTTKSLVAQHQALHGTGVDLTPALIGSRADLFGLRPRTGGEARMNREEALNLHVLSPLLRANLERSIPGALRGVVDLRIDPKLLRERLFDPEVRPTWLRPEAVPALRQLLMHEHKDVRLLLVEALDQIKGPGASTALVGIAMFDLHAEVRAAALVALKQRPKHEYEQSFVWGLRYPWVAFADHAAEALVALQLRDTVRQLIPLLDARDLMEPFPVDWGQKRQVMIAELVRINHLRSCLLCHPPSFLPNDPVRAPVPHSQQLVPLPSSGPRIGPPQPPSAVQMQTAALKPATGGGAYGSGSLPSLVSGGTKTITVPGGKTVTVEGPKAAIVLTFIRADITYLKQDFSILQPEPNHGLLWPEEQRYDYLVRLRPLTRQEQVLWQGKLKDFRPLAPQRESLLYALRELTGENPGPFPEDWKRIYSPITGQRLEKPLEPDDQVLHLKASLLEAGPPRQAELLLEFRDRTGLTYDRAMALAMPQLPAELKSWARNILADRMYNLRRQELRERLRDKEREIRRAAVKVCRLRQDKALAPDLITLLEDEEPEVARQAHQFLREIALKDFGPPRAANPEQRRQAVAAWRVWWEQRSKTEQKQADS
jgi:hypothetical protein